MPLECVSAFNFYYRGRRVDDGEGVARPRYSGPTTDSSVSTWARWSAAESETSSASSS